MGKYKGRITKIEKSTITGCTLTQGIKKPDQQIFDDSDSYGGSNGSYTSDYYSEYAVNLYLTIYATETEPERKVIIDIRDSILQENGLKRISTQKMNQIKNDNEGKKVSFDIINGKIIFDSRELKL